MTAPLPALAVLTNRFPVVSETFVWREARELRARGWPLLAVGIRPAPSHDPTLPEADVVLHDRGVAGVFADACVELLRHPLATLATLGLALRDALAPGEPLAAGRRVRLLFHGLTGLAAARRLRPAGVRHIHCHFAHAPASAGMYAARQLAIRFSFAGHANDLFASRTLLGRKLERAAFVACISEWHREWYRSLVERPSRLELVRCGVEVAAPTATQRANGEGAPRAGPLRVLGVARLVPKKGFDLLLRALAQVGSSEALDWTLTLAGDGPERPALASLAAELGIGERVQFLGTVSSARVAELLQEADVFALPCRVDPSGDRDGIPVALMEAMAAGLPVLTGALPTIRELVEQERTGLLCEPEDVAALAASIARLARDPGLRSRLGAGGRERVERDFSLARNVGRLDAALRRALALPEAGDAGEPRGEV